MADSFKQKSQAPTALLLRCVLILSTLLIWELLARFHLIDTFFFRPAHGHCPGYAGGLRQR